MIHVNDRSHVWINIVFLMHESFRLCKGHIFVRRHIFWWCAITECIALVALQSSQARIAALYLPLLTIIIENKTRLQPKDSAPPPPCMAVNGDALADTTLSSRRSSTAALGSYTSQMSLDQASLASGMSSVSQQRPPVRDPNVFSMISGQGYFRLYVVMGNCCVRYLQTQHLISAVFILCRLVRKKFILLYSSFCAKVDDISFSCLNTVPSTVLNLCLIIITGTSSLVFPVQWCIFWSFYYWNAEKC